MSRRRLEQVHSRLAPGPAAVLAHVGWWSHRPFVLVRCCPVTLSTNRCCAFVGAAAAKAWIQEAVVSNRSWDEVVQVRCALRRMVSILSLIHI